jgi:hypothetical protein
LTGALTGTTAEFISESTQITLRHSGTGQNNILFKSESNEIFKMGIANNNSSIIFENLPLSQKTSGFKFYSVNGLTKTLGLDQDINGNLGIKSESTPSSLHPNTLYVNGTLGVTGNITEGGNNVLTNLDTASLSTRIDAKLSPSDTVSLSNRIDSKVSLTGDQTISGTKTFNNLVNITNQMTISGSVSGANILLGKNTSTNGVGDITIGTGLSLASNILTATQIDTTSLSNRINGKVGLTGNETISGDKTFTNKIILNDSSRFESNVLFKKNFGLPIVKISNANYTATTANHTIIYTTLTSDKTLTIPNASDAVGIKYTISIFDTPEGNEALTIVTPSNNSFVITDGEGASVDIVGGYCTILQSDGIKWYVLSYSPMY